MHDADAETSYRSALAVSRAIARASDAAPHPRRLEIVLGGNCNVDFLKPGLEAALWADGVTTAVRSTAYDDWVGAALEQKESADAWVIWLSSAAWSRYSQLRPDPPVATIGAAVRAIRQTGAGVVVILPEPDPAEVDPFSPFVQWREELVSRLRAAIHEHAVLIDPTSLLAQCAPGWSDFRYWIAAKCPWSPDAATRLGALCGHTLARLGQPRVRAVVVDLDDTLWGGIVGELGAGGVMLDPLGEGAPFLVLQRFLKDLGERGIMLCVATKNDFADAASVFEQRAEMILKPEDFLRFEANWDSKAESVRRIALALNLDRSAICFLDNSEHERAEMRQLLPGVVVPELPAEPGDRIRFLHESRLFLKPVVRDDDLTRVQSYRADADRERHQHAAPDRDSYLAGLSMHLTARPLERGALGRPAELVQKTNQFNLTNHRHSEKRLLEIVEAPGVYAYAFDLSDTFGEAGTIGVVVALPAPAPDGLWLEIDTFVMSCRVINRTVERAMFAHLTEWARARDVRGIRGYYTPSARNQLAADFYLSVGLARAATPTGEAQDSLIFESVEPRAPDHRVATVRSAQVPVR